jgi:acyl carrier protein
MPNEAPTDREILEQFAQIVAGSLQIDAEKVTEEAYLDDLGAESLDLMEITMEVEEEFNILIPQKNILQTAQEMIGEGVLVKDGKLTEQGKRLLEARLPEIAARAGEELSVTDLNRMFLRVSGWVRMIARLMEHTPRVCARCGQTFGKQVAGRLKCKSCAAEYDIPSGDDLNRQWVQEYSREAPALPPSVASPGGVGG